MYFTPSVSVTVTISSPLLSSPQTLILQKFLQYFCVNSNAFLIEIRILTIPSEIAMHLPKNLWQTEGEKEGGEGGVWTIFVQMTVVVRPLAKIFSISEEKSQMERKENPEQLQVISCCQVPTTISLLSL